MDVYLSKSKYCKAIQCNKILWLDKYKKEYMTETSNEAILADGIEVGKLARGILGNFANIEYNEDKTIMIEQTKLLMKKAPNIITEASFTYNNNFCSVDILKNDKDGIEIYEVKSTLDMKEINLDDVSYQVYVLKNLGYKVKSVNLVHLNREYRRKGELELKKLFKIENITDIVASKQNEVEEKIKEINEYMKQTEEPKDSISENCFMNSYECPYWKYCSRNLPKNNVFDIAGMRTKAKVQFYKNGKISFQDLENEQLGEKYKQQIEVEASNETIINNEKIREFLKTITYPIYFLDFEGYKKAIPEYDNTWPAEQIPFQYSIHYIEKENAPVKHLEFIAENGKDPRRIIAEKLVENIPQNACIVVYNNSYESTRLTELSELYEDLKDSLVNLREHIVDIIVPFRSRWYYCKEMQGSYSIKYVLPALYPNEPSLDYHNLPVVHNGTEASQTYLDLPNHTKEEQEKIKKGMFLYCGLDTYALVKVWEKLKKVVEE